MLQAAELGNLKNQAIVVAPQFLDDDDVTAHSLNSNYLRWRGSPNGMIRGFNSLNSNPLSSFAVMDSVILRLVNKNPNLCQIIVAGHSSGGQYVNRYAAVNRAENLISVPVKYIVANPSSYLYMDNKRRVSTSLNQFQVPSSGCSGYNSWRYGLHNSTACPYLSSVADSTIRGQFKERDVVYLLGAMDNDPNHSQLETTCAAMAQGNHRLERGIIYFNHLKQYYNSNYSFDINSTQNIVVVPNAAHSSAQLILSTEGLAAMFDIQPEAAGWEVLSPALTSNHLQDVFFIDSLYGWVCGNSGTILRTTNGGNSWSAPSSVSGTSTSHIRSIFFINRNTGWATRNSGRVLKTTNGGVN